MKEKIKAISLDVFLVFLVLFLFLVFHVVYIAGPKRVMEHEDRLFIEAFQQKEKLKNLEYVNRFSLDKIYYIAKDENTIYYFDENMVFSEKAIYKAPDSALAKGESWGFSARHMSYGVFNKELVYRFEKKNHIIFLDYETLDVVFEFGG